MTDAAPITRKDLNALGVEIADAMEEDAAKPKARDRFALIERRLLELEEAATRP